MELTRQATESPRGSVVVFLGDNLYPKGLPAEDDPGRAEAERRLEVQLDVARASQRRVIFLAGNHDWERWGKGGEGAIIRVSDYLRERVKGLSRQLPDSACPGPVVQDIGTAVRLVLIDTQWWLQNHEKQLGPNSYCEAKTEDDVVAGLKVALATAGERHVIVAGHHPLESGGEHGGHWSIGKWIFPLREVKSWLWIPLPIIGAIYPLARMNGISSQDLSGSKNEYMRARLAEAFAEHPPLLYAAGHDHNLQVFRGPDAKFSIVSGSGIIDHQEAVKYKDNTLYAIDSESGARLNPGWRKGVRIGRASDGEVLYYIPPHFIWDTFLFPSGITVYSEGAAGDGITVDADGNVYAGEVGTGNPIVGITKYIRRFELAR